MRNTHLLGGAVGWTSVPPRPCLGLPPPGSLPWVVFFVGTPLNAHGACGHTVASESCGSRSIYILVSVSLGASSASSLSLSSSSAVVMGTSSSTPCSVPWRPSFLG